MRSVRSKQRIIRFIYTTVIIGLKLLSFGVSGIPVLGPLPVGLVPSEFLPSISFISKASSSRRNLLSCSVARISFGGIVTFNSCIFNTEAICVDVELRFFDQHHTIITTTMSKKRTMPPAITPACQAVEKKLSLVLSLGVLMSPCGEATNCTEMSSPTPLAKSSEWSMDVAILSFP